MNPKERIEERASGDFAADVERVMTGAPAVAFSASVRVNSAYTRVAAILNGLVLDIAIAHHNDGVGYCNLCETALPCVTMQIVESHDPGRESPERRISMVEAYESTLRGRMLMAQVRYESAKAAFDEAVAEGRDVDAVRVPRQRGGSFVQAAAEASMRAARAKFGMDRESPDGSS